MFTFTKYEDVPEKYWKGVLARARKVVRCGGGFGTHCSNEEYELNGWLYDITYEGTTVIDIRRKKITNVD